MLLFDERKSERTKAAKYLRLSSEDGDKGESNSISNQRELIEAYVRKHSEISPIGEYVDDGYTGTNFERPGFKRMIKDAQSGRINCIIVKDLSRLGRDYIGMGRYMERIFPLMGIRFIAINDNYDSAKQEALDDNTIVLFKNLLNDAYSRDISVKVRTQLDVKRRKGEFVGGFAPFGYKKDEKDRNCLTIDGEAAGIVYNIFQWKLDGLSAKKIAERLNDGGVPCPYEYKRKNGMDFHTGFKPSGSAKWGTAQVLRILSNEIYAGTLVQGKRSKVNYKMKKLKDVEESDWIRVEGSHEPIVSREMFDMVQDVLRMDTRTSPKDGGVGLFSGIARCGGCGAAMVRRKVVKNGRQYTYLHCSTYHKGKGCASHLISERKLCGMVFSKIREDIDTVAAIGENMEHIGSAAAGCGTEGIYEDEIGEARQRARYYLGLLRNLKGDMERGIITEGEYAEFSADFEIKREEAEKDLDELEKKRERIVNLDTDGMPWFGYFMKYAGCGKISRRMLIELVEDIVVTDKEHAKVIYRYGDEIENFIKYCSRACGGENKKKEGFKA